jgi:O-antigen/teichoic acid export membrane protein
MTLGFWSVAEQGLSSVTFLGVHIALARWTSGTLYGEFAISFAVLVLLEITHRALFGEPALVFFARYRSHRGAAYSRILILGHLVATSGISVLLLAVAGASVLLEESSFAAAMVGLAITLPFLLSASLLRRLCYAHFRPRVAALGGTVNLLAVAGGIGALYLSDRLSSLTAYLVLGGGAALLSLLVIWRLGIMARGRPASPTRRRVLADHWEFARSAIPTGVLAWIPVHAYYIVLPLLEGVGRDASGQLRAAVTMVMPLLQVNAALGTLLVATFSSRLASGTALGAATFAWLLSGVSFGYWMLLIVMGGPLMELVYGQGFASTAQVLSVLGALPVLTAPAHVMRSLSFSRNRPGLVLRSQAVAAAVTMTAGLLMVHRWFLGGAAGGMLLAVGAQTVTLGWYLRAAARHGTRDSG